MAEEKKKKVDEAAEVKAAAKKEDKKAEEAKVAEKVAETKKDEVKKAEPKKEEPVAEAKKEELKAEPKAEPKKEAPKKEDKKAEETKKADNEYSYVENIRLWQNADTYNTIPQVFSGNIRVVSEVNDTVVRVEHMLAGFGLVQSFALKADVTK